MDKAEITYKAAKGSNRYRIRRWFYHNREACLFALELAALLGLQVSRTLSNNDIRLNLLTASALHVMMKVPVQDETGYKLESIVSLERINGKFLEIEVEDASNFYEDGILLHCL